MKHASRLTVLIVALLACATSAARAAAPQSKPVFTAIPDVETRHTMSLHGKRLDYVARAGTITIRDANEKPLASMFYTAYTAEPKNASRPITFVYNGGPGSSSIWLRMGSFGPVRVVTPGEPTGAAPFELVENQDTLLDVTDLVFVDMAGSGFGRLLPGSDPKAFFGADADVANFAQFIERYLNAFDRWNAPKYLFGESYGAPRSAMLANYLQQANVGLNGIILQSSLLNESLSSPVAAGGAGTDDWAFVFALPTEAATAYHYRMVPDPPRTLAGFVAQASHFALTEYRAALAEGNQLSAARRNEIARQLHRYTGLSEAYVRNSNLRVPGLRFVSELRRKAGLTQGVYDSQIELSMLDRGQEYPAIDPTNQLYGPPYFALANQYLRRTLHYNPPLLYRAGAYQQIQQAGGWDFRHNGSLPMDTAGDLAQAMVANPKLRVFSAGGYFDVVTPFSATVYTLNHLGVAPSIQRNISYGFYAGGHMAYANADALAQYHRDLELWYRSANRIR